MAKKHQKETKEEILFMDQATVHRFYLNGAAQTGTVIHTNIDGTDKQLFVTADHNGYVTDVQFIDRVGQSIRADKPTVVLSGNHDSSMQIANGYYAQGKRMHLSRSGADATTDAFYDRNLFSGEQYLSLYEKSRAWEAALAELDSHMKREDQRAVLIDYLNRATEEYYEISKQLRNETDTSFVRNQHDAIGVMKNEADAILHDHGDTSFEASMKRYAHDVHADNSQHIINGLYRKSQSMSETYFERTKAAVDVFEEQMKTRYYETSNRVLDTHRTALTDSGLTGAIGLSSEASLRQINTEIDKQKEEFLLMTRRHATTDELTQKQEYIRALSDVSACHPFNIARSNAEYMNADIARKLSALTTESGERIVRSDLSEKIGDETRKSIQADIYRHGSEEGFGLLSAHDGYARYRMMPDIQFYGGDNSYGIVPGSKVDPLAYANRTYQGMTQHEFLQYLGDKSEVVLAIHRERMRPMIDDRSAEGAGRPVDRIDEIYKQGIGNLSEEQRIANVASYIKNSKDGGWVNTPQMDRFFKSEEFAKIVRDPNALYVLDGGKGPKYVQFDGNKLSTTDARVLRPEYAFGLQNSMSADSKENNALNVFAFNSVNAFGNPNNILSKSNCDVLMEHCNRQLRFDALLQERSSQELLAIREFLQDHIDYNERMISMDYNRRMSVGLDQDMIQYNSKTLHLLNDHSSSNVMDVIRENRELYSGVIFDRHPDAFLINSNYNALSEFLEKKDDDAIRKLRDALREDIVSGVTITRGTDHLARDNYGYIASSASEQDMRAAQLLDVATALRSELNENKLNAFNAVMDSHEIRNGLIDQIRSSVTLYANLDSESDRRIVFERLHKLDGDILDPSRSGVSDQERAKQIAEALNIKLSDNDDVLSKQVVLLNSSEFIQEVQQLKSRIDQENHLTLSSEYILSLEKTNGIDSYRQLAANIDTVGDNKVNLELIGDIRYLEYVKEHFGRESEQAALIEKIEAENSYYKMVLLTRNLEEMTHCGHMTVAEEQNARKIAQDIAFCVSTENANATSIDESIVRLQKYEQMINRSLDVSQTSPYIQARLEEAEKTVVGTARLVEDDLRVAFLGKERVQQSNNPDAFVVMRAIGSDREFNNLRTSLVAEMQSNRNYEAYRAINERGETLRRIQELEKEAEFKQECADYTRQFIDTASRRRRAGVISMCAVYDEEAQEARTEIRRLRKTLNASMGMLDDKTEVLQKAYQTEKSHSAALDYADALLKASDKGTGFSDRNNVGDICRTLEAVDAPLAARADLYEIRCNFAEQYRNEIKERVTAICNERIDEIQKDVWLNAKDIYSVGYNLTFRSDEHGSVSVDAVKAGDSETAALAGKVVFADKNSVTLDTPSGLVRLSHIEDLQKQISMQSEETQSAMYSLSEKSRTEITEAIIQSTIDHSRVQLANAPDQDKIAISAAILKGESQLEEMRTLDRIRTEMALDRPNVEELFVHPTLNGSGASMSNAMAEYIEADRMYQNAIQDRDELVRFNAARHAYEKLSEMGDQLSGLGYVERAKVAEAFATSEQALSSGQIREAFAKAANEAGYGEESFVKDYVSAYADIATKRIGIDKALDGSDMSHAQFISNYNHAVQELKAHPHELEQIIDRMNIPDEYKMSVREHLEHQYEIDRFAPVASVAAPSTETAVVTDVPAVEETVDKRAQANEWMRRVNEYSGSEEKVGMVSYLAVTAPDPRTLDADETVAYRSISELAAKEFCEVKVSELQGKIAEYNGGVPIGDAQEKMVANFISVATTHRESEIATDFDRYLEMVKTSELAKEDKDRIIKAVAPAETAEDKSAGAGLDD